jgi:WhiB family transcriptional regulator, redox-sensing transcriptional regulator
MFDRPGEAGAVAEISRLPGPNAELWEWQLRGACRTVSSDLFFHPEGERGPSRRNRELAAKQVCGQCPVVMQCRAHALAVREPYGIWGGMSEDEREAVYVLRKQQPARFSEAS